MKVRRSAEKGFSLIEMVLVVAIVLIVSAMAIPSVVTAMYNVRMRSSAYSLSGLIQAARVQAIQSNSDRFICQAARTSDNVTRAWVQSSYTCIDADTANSSGSTYSQVTMGGTVKIIPAKGTGEPSPALTAAVLGFAPPPTAAVGALPSFNARGIPCFRSAANARCVTTVTSPSGSVGISQLWYLTDTRPGGSKGYMAVAVTPAGRVQVWTYDSGKWTR